MHGWLGAASIILQVLLFIMKQVDRKQLDDAEKKGFDVGALRAILAFQEEIDARIAKAKSAGDDVLSGRVSVDSATDPNNRANRPDQKETP